MFRAGGIVCVVYLHFCLVNHEDPKQTSTPRGILFVGIDRQVARRGGGGVYSEILIRHLWVGSGRCRARCDRGL